MSAARRTNTLTTCLASAFLLVAAAMPARADHLDEQLNKSAPKLVDQLRKAGYKNVGVLRFRVQVGKQPASFQTGAINGNLVDRLENALVLHMGADESHAVGIIHNTGKEAGMRQIADWYGKPADRKKLFAIDTYPRAWGGHRVRADAFLTGVLHVAADYKTAKLEVELFTAGDPARLVKLAELPIETDLPLLRDLGKSFTVSRGGSARSTARLTTALRREMILEQVAKRDGADPSDGGGDANTKPIDDGNPSVSGPLTVDGIEVKILAGGDNVAIRDDGSARSIVCPPEGKAVVISLRNTSERKLGVDVKLNGKSLLFEQTDEAENCRLWVIDPGKTYLLKGWYLNEESLKNVAPFNILVGEEAREKKESIGPKAGDLDVAVFESTPKSTEEGERVPGRGLRGLPSRIEKKARAGLETYQHALLKASKQKRSTVTTMVNGSAVKREMIVADSEAEKFADQKLTAVDFPNVTPLGTACIKILPGKSNGNDAP